MSHLIPCPCCTRHVRVTEEACPFCAGELPEALRAEPPRKMPSSRLSRAATYALGTALGAGIAAATACGDSGSHVSMYGAPPDTTTGGETTGGGDTTAADAGVEETDPPNIGTPVPAYGVPAPVPQVQTAPPPSVNAYGAPAPAYGGPPRQP